MRRNRKNRSGATAVEMALVLPIIFLMLFAAIDFARACNVKNSIVSAAYEGSRTAVLPEKDEQDIRNVVQDNLDAVGIVDANIVIEPTQITSDTPEVTVTITVPLGANLYVGAAFLSDRDLTTSCSLTRESALVELVQ